MSKAHSNVHIELAHDSKLISGYLLGVYKTNNKTYAAVVEDGTSDMFIYECTIKDHSIDFLAVVEEDIEDIVDYFKNQLNTKLSSTE